MDSCKNARTEFVLPWYVVANFLLFAWVAWVLHRPSVSSLWYVDIHSFRPDSLDCTVHLPRQCNCRWELCQHLSLSVTIGRTSCLAQLSSVMVHSSYPLHEAGAFCIAYCYCVNTQNFKTVCSFLFWEYRDWCHIYVPYQATWISRFSSKQSLVTLCSIQQHSFNWGFLLTILFW